MGIFSTCHALIAGFDLKMLAAQSAAVRSIIWESREWFTLRNHLILQLQTFLWLPSGGVWAQGWAGKARAVRGKICLPWAFITEGHIGFQYIINSLQNIRFSTIPFAIPFRHLYRISRSDSRYILLIFTVLNDISLLCSSRLSSRAKQTRDFSWSILFV